MNLPKHFFSLAFAAGALALLWVASGFLGSHALALAVTLVIAAVYGLGAHELLRFRQATATLDSALQALEQPPPELFPWLERLHPSLHNPVRQRIEGERGALPGPMLTPYLVGLLVMLGMLGTFLGMVATLNGAVFALEGTADLAAMRSAFALPIKGLGLAFGTSVAGVASSAMLGLMSALSRRERLQAVHRLDSHIAGTLRGFSLSHQRQQAYLALQQQALALPAVMEQMQALMARMETMGAQLGARLLANQEGFHSGAQAAYTALAHSVEQSLRESLAHSADSASARIEPLVQQSMVGMAEQARAMHERMLASTQAELQTFSTRLAANASAQQQALCEALERTAGQISHSAHSSAEKTRNEVQRLIETASEAPRAAAEVIGALRREVSRSAARDNELLEERSRILETLNGLLASIGHASAEQRAVIDSLVASSAGALQGAGAEFAHKVEGETGKLAELAAQVSSSAVEVSSLGQAFGFAVGAFNEGNEKLIANLQRIEAAMDKSMARSDEQLAYYVAQAREVIDLSIGSQKEVVQELRALRSQAALGAETAEAA